MSEATIYTVSDGKLTAMLPAAPESEDTMQKLIADHPEIITDRDGRLLLIRREQPISDNEDSGGRWSLDHLFVTREGIPVLVELKRAVDTRSCSLACRKCRASCCCQAIRGQRSWPQSEIAPSNCIPMRLIARAKQHFPLRS